MDALGYRLIPTAGLIVSMILATVARPQSAAGASDVVRVIVRPQVSVDHPDIRVGDIAFVEDGSPVVRQQIARLDLGYLTRAGQSLAVSQEQVLFRIQIAGVDRRRFEVEGAAEALVHLEGLPPLPAAEIAPEGRIADPGLRQAGHRPALLTESAVLAAARDYLLKQLPWPHDDIRLSLAQPLRIPPLSVGPDETIQLEPELPATASTPGRIRVDVAARINGTRRAVVVVHFDLRVLQPVALARRRIEAGESLGDGNMYADRRLIDGSQSYPTYEECRGKRTRRPILPGQAIARADLEPTSEEGPVLIRARQPVKIIARAGSLLVSAGGEALQDGRAGQLIRVRNLDSKATLTGRVVDRSTVAIDP